MSEDDIILKLEKIITETCDDFCKRNMKYFSKEEDFQSYLYARLLESGMFYDKTREHLLIRREYPTESRYRTEKHLYISYKQGEGEKSHGELDIAIVDPNHDYKDYKPIYPLLAGIEIKLPREYKEWYSSVSTPKRLKKELWNDIIKLLDKKNEIPNRYLVILLHRKLHRNKDTSIFHQNVDSGLREVIEKFPSQLKQRDEQNDLRIKLGKGTIKIFYREVLKKNGDTEIVKTSKEPFECQVIP